jgi:hypothetical protein
VYGDWASDIELGDDWAYRPGGPHPPPPPVDTRLRYPNTNTPRDSFMRPIADPIGVVDRRAAARHAVTPSVPRVHAQGGVAVSLCSQSHTPSARRQARLPFALVDCNLSLGVACVCVCVCVCVCACHTTTLGSS